MSHYLKLSTIRHAIVQDSAYIGLGIAETMMIFVYPHGLAWMISLACAAFGIVGVTVTGAIDRGAHHWVTRLHVAFAGFAFGGALVAEAVYLWHTREIWFVVAALASTMAFARFAPQAKALEEKTLAAWVIVALFAIVGIPL